MGPDFAILVAGENRIESAIAIAEEKGASLFLMHTGVKALADPRLEQLLTEGHDVTACAADAEAHGFRPREGGPRFGSQHDHALLVRDARRFLSLTPRGAFDSFPGDRTGRCVRVRLCSAAHSPETAQALRSAVGYAALGLDVTIALDSEATALLQHLDHPPAILRALGTLRGLGCPIETLRDDPKGYHITVSW